MTEKHWFIFRGDHHLGPFSFQEILDKVKLDQIDDNELTWCEGHEEWMPLKDQPAIIEALRSERDAILEKEERERQHQLMIERKRQEQMIARQAEQEKLAQEQKRLQEVVEEDDGPPPLPPIPGSEPEGHHESDQHEELNAEEQFSKVMTGSFMEAADNENKKENLEVVTFLNKDLNENLDGEKDYEEGYEEGYEEDDEEYDEDDTGEYEVVSKRELDYDNDYSDEQTAPGGGKFYAALFLSLIGVSLVVYLLLQTSPGERRLFNVAGRDKDALYNVMARPFRGVPIHRLRPTKDLNSLWFATNFPDEAILYMTLKSLPGRTLGEGEVEVQGTAHLKGKAALFDQLEVLKGETLHVGEYAYEIKGLRVGLKGKLSKAFGKDGLLAQMKFLRTQDQEFNLKGTLLLSPYGSDEFDKRLKEQKVFFDKTIIRPLKDHKQRYQTFLGLLDRLNTLYMSIMRRITKGKSIKMFEDRYNEEVGPFLRDLIIDCNRLYLSLVNLRPEQSKVYEELMNFGKDIGLIASEMVTKTRRVKKLTSSKTQYLIDHFTKKISDLKEKGEREQRFIEMKLAPYENAKSDKPTDPAP